MQRLWQTGRWYDEERQEEFLQLAAEYNRITDAEIEAQLEAGQIVAYGPDWYSRLRNEPAPRAPRITNETECSCGHTIPAVLVMNASQGSSCPDCYDRMSD